MQAAVMLTEFGAGAAKIVTVPESDPIAVAADADANAEIFRAGYGRCCNGNRRHGCKRKTKFSHVPSSPVAAREKTVEPKACSSGEALSLAPDQAEALCVKGDCLRNLGKPAGSGEGRRYAHGACYVRASLEAAGLVVLQLEQQPIRCEAGVPVPGLVIVAQKP
ncbi:MAG: hypothetical protein QOJ86_2974 [Bradyrhizobium sp.]|nr:hypothetical protein [Bradyrhizobium sp.]